MAREDKGAAWDKRVRNIGLALLHLERHAVPGQPGEPELTTVVFKLDADNRTSVLVILKAMEGEERVVGFVGGPDLSSAAIAVGKKIAAGAVRWREDRPWEGGQ